MSQHYSEADLLETYYTRPGQSMPVMMHLADCSECAARYERLERKLRSLDACDTTEKPETFWARQRMSVMQRIQRHRSPVPRLAAAAALVLALGGVAAWRATSKTTPAKAPVTVETQSAIDETDPWQSEELQDYHSMVAWESWVASADTTTGATGDQSL